MEVLTGFRLNSNLYLDKESQHLYKLVKMVNHVSYFSCYKTGCRGTAVFKDECKIGKKHNHKPDLKDLNLLIILNNCKRRVMYENTFPREIFEEEVAKITDNIPEINFKDIENCLTKCRKREQPVNTESVSEFAVALAESRYSKTADNRPFFATYQQLPDTAENIIFTSPSILASLDMKATMYADATFRTLPESPRFKLLLILHVNAYTYSFPVLYAFMSKDHEHAYIEVFKYLKSICPDYNPTAIITGFDIPMQRAAQQVFGVEHSQLLGCYFHFSQVMIRELNQPHIDLRNYLSEDGIVKNFVGQVLSLPLLPIQRVQEALHYLEQQFNAIHDQNIKPKIRCLLDYVHNFWIQQVGFQSLCLHWRSCEINNNVVQYHNLFNKSVGPAYTNMWLLLDKVIKSERREAVKFEKAGGGGTLSVEGKGKSILKDGKIKQLMERIDKNKIAVDEYLNCLSERIWGYVEHTILEIDDQTRQIESMNEHLQQDSPTHPSTSDLSNSWTPIQPQPSPHVNMTMDRPIEAYPSSYPSPVKPDYPTMPRNDRLLSHAVCCKLCHSNQLQLYFRPCGHVWLCISCWNMIKATTPKPSCPKCFKPVLEALKAYLE